MNGFYLSSNIKYLRSRDNISQSKLAKVIGKTPAAIANYEAGIREPNAVDLGKIANYFNISVDSLFLEDLRFNNQKETINNKFKDVAIILPKDCGKWKQGESVLVEDFMEYIDELKQENDKLTAIKEMLK